MPVVSEEMEMDAVPLTSDALPSVVEVEVSVKTTVPVGVPDDEVTAAVKVTLCPETDGFGEEARVVAVATPFTTCVSAADVLGAKVLDP